MNQHSKVDSERIFGERKADHRILNTALYLHEQNPGRKVIMVTKDINLRLKAKSLNLTSEDYETGKIKDIDEMYTGRTVVENVSSAAIDEIYEKGSSDPAPVLKKSKPVAKDPDLLKK